MIDKQLEQGLTHYLLSFVLPERAERLRAVLDNRTRHVTVVVEDLYQTQNISAVLRSCECYGIQDVHIIENENEFQVHSAIAMGADKWLTLHNYKNGEHNTRDCIQYLKANGYTVVATLPNDDSLYINELPVEDKTAFLFGTELTGLSEEAIQLCDKTVKIPMYGFTESFNISNSAAIILSTFVERLRNSAIDWHLSEKEAAEIYLEWLCKSVRSSDLLVNKYLNDNNLAKNRKNGSTDLTISK